MCLFYIKTNYRIIRIYDNTINCFVLIIIHALWMYGVCRLQYIIIYYVNLNMINNQPMT